MEVFGGPPPPLPIGPMPSKKGKKTPQEVLSEFWEKFHTKKPGKVTSIFPRSLYQNILPPTHPAGARSSRNARESYEAAAKECREKVKRIIRECERTNEKFTDPDFDIERDDDNNCLNGLVRDSGSSTNEAPVSQPAVSAWDVKNSLETLAQSQVLGGSGRIHVDANALSRIMASDSNNYYDGVSAGEYYSPGSVHRVDWIFESPQFSVGGFSSTDIKQGANGDCWWLAAVATIAHRKDLMNKVCVARDEECGVYGFVFQRDGEWLSTVIDDNLYLKSPDFDAYGDMYDATGRKAKKHRKAEQTGSDALYFARCEDPNETWLPLLEKAYAKIHGDYEAISGGWPGEAVEDMTGGVTTTIASNRVLRKDKLWKELVNSDGEFVFALAAFGTGWDWQKSGLALGHAYSILEAREEVDEDGNKVRLVKIRNPWGERAWNGVGEWNGPWSDGSREWTPYWLKKIGHTFGDDGIFWMSYKDMLETFMFLHRTRLFDEKWTVVQQWTSANVSWVTGYLRNKFEIEVKKAGPVIIVLTQLDERYFRGFQGEYYFELHFILQEVGAAASDHICRVRPVHKWENRSVTCEVELEPGKYEVLPKITATRESSSKPVEDIVKEYADKNPQKLRQVGMAYDLAHAKGGLPNEDDLLEKKKADEKRKKEEEKRKRKVKAKRRKAVGKAAEALASAADAMKEIAQSDSTEGKKDAKSSEEQTGSNDKEKPDVAGGPTTEPKEQAVQEPKSAADSKPNPTPSSRPTSSTPALESNKEEPPATSSGLKDAPLPPDNKDDPKESEAKESDLKEEAHGVEEKDEKKNDNVDDGDEEESESDSESESDDDDDDQNANPWNAVAVVGLRVYARDPEVSVTLKAATTEEATTLVVEGQPAGATI
ncbi:hypothetical protein JX265_007572 [Neoarthrinium moseri]|uniref:Calpain catalytic domain-containing protein n=1 Tax=Neoarthrinium moseri TaxID=1658444 RepID=A0A9P9WJS5_9PEZI|nr:hypothetical protein JX265_007572 [Neoarthrinium moseri]